MGILVQNLASRLGLWKGSPSPLATGRALSGPKLPLHDPGITWEARGHFGSSNFGSSVVITLCLSLSCHSDSFLLAPPRDISVWGSNARAEIRLRGIHPS